ncbi:unnamed protein product [Thlaspi arvense]|uniref:DUF4283 domain-containing protein n=1 Tax=Thlaspi arvense TaxID=13288 RepID=A0AAU9R4W8_THLAR|nr:unnamed protein product [Thlaspi arvense]
MAFAEEVAIFAETSLGTRIVMTVPLNITSADLKRNTIKGFINAKCVFFAGKLEKTHASCLPSFGEIRVSGLMVKRKSQFYHLAESVSIKYIFRDNQKPWFIHAEAILVNRWQEPSMSNKSIERDVGLINDQNKTTKKSLPRNPASFDNKREFLDPPTSVPETIRRSSLPTARATESERLRSFIPKTPKRKTGASVSISETISKKLIVAANNIKMQGKSRMSSSLSSSIFRSKTRRKRSLDAKTVTSLAKFLVFQIPDTED